MELTETRDTLHFERLAADTEEQVTIEGEATLPGSMRDAVTVLSVQAQAHLHEAQAGNGEAAVRGKVCFQVLYTQGDLTRVRALETTCDFEHRFAMPDVTPQMRLEVSDAVQETQGTAANGRMTLRALLGLQAAAFETVDKELLTGAELTGEADGDNDAGGLQTRKQSVSFCCHEPLGTDQTMVREEFDLPAKLEVGDVLSASAEASVGELTGGAGRVGITGVVEVRVLHRPLEAGRPLVMTQHELPYELSMDVTLPQDVNVQASCEVVDVMADSAAAEKRRTLRVEAEVRVRLSLCRQQETVLLEDLYSITGPELEPVRETLSVHTFEERMDARESTRVQVNLPKEQPPMETVLAAFVQPTLTGVSPAGHRLDAEGVMAVTLLYLPVDSDIPCAVQTREPFTMTFPVEARGRVHAQAYAIEAVPGPNTSDRAEVRCVIGLRAVDHGIREIHGITKVNARPAAPREPGFVLVWPEHGETRWQTARRLRVAEDSLCPAGQHALLAFRR